MKRNTVRWFGCLDRKTSDEFVMKVYVSETKDPWRREKPVVRWKDRVKEYIQ